MGSGKRTSPAMRFDTAIGMGFVLEVRRSSIFPSLQPEIGKQKFQDRRLLCVQMTRESRRICAILIDSSDCL